MKRAIFASVELRQLDQTRLNRMVKCVMLVSIALKEPLVALLVLLVLIVMRKETVNLISANLAMQILSKTTWVQLNVNRAKGTLFQILDLVLVVVLD